MKIVTELKRLKDRVFYFETPLDLQEGKCEIEIKEFRNKRTSQQNRYMWELLTEIVRKQNGGRTTESLRMDLYASLLKECGAKEIYCEIEPKDLKRFQKKFRATRIVGYNKERGRYKIIAYFGTSEMNTKEMSEFIDYILDYASQCGIYTEYWKELLKNE